MLSHCNVAELLSLRHWVYVQIATDAFETFLLCLNHLGFSFKEFSDKLLVCLFICSSIPMQFDLLSSSICAACKSWVCSLQRGCSLQVFSQPSRVSRPVAFPSWFAVHGSLSSFLSLRAPLFYVRVNLQQLLCDCFPAPLCAQPSK